MNAPGVQPVRLLQVGDLFTCKAFVRAYGRPIRSTDPGNTRAPEVDRTNLQLERIEPEATHIVTLQPKRTLTPSAVRFEVFDETRGEAVFEVIEARESAGWFLVAKGRDRNEVMHFRQTLPNGTPAVEIVIVGRAAQA